MAHGFRRSKAAAIVGGHCPPAEGCIAAADVLYCAVKEKHAEDGIVKAGEYFRKFKDGCTKERVRNRIGSWAKFLLNPRLLMCLLIAWMITNGWSYIMFGLGLLLKIDWMYMVGGAYMSLLWLPFTPEKLITVLIAIGLMRFLYPKDQRTLGVLKAKLARFRKDKQAAR